MQLLKQPLSILLSRIGEKVLTKTADAASRKRIDSASDARIRRRRRQIRIGQALRNRRRGERIGEVKSSVRVRQINIFRIDILHVEAEFEIMRADNARQGILHLPPLFLSVGGSQS